ncbi:MAG: biotin carboxylase N-terminal domain-containing protein [Candidatus Binatia bacterium]
MTRRIAKVLIANRGEIARRVLRTCRRLGIAGVAVYSDADAAAAHVAEADEAVRIGPAESLQSYLSIDRVLAAAAAVGADAVHPGYGFLAENADFAARCVDAGLVFIGPPAEVIRQMGSKIAAREIMARSGVPVVPGISGAGLDDAQLAAAAQRLELPLLIKAAAGGGGKGMRLVRVGAELSEAIAAARREARQAFGDDALLIERYLDAPRHIEVQIFGDRFGRVAHLVERECSIQRRFQKVIEEAPSPAIDGALRSRLGAAAVTAGEAIGYAGAGTVEFIVDARGAFYFLEVNTRLQVEHPVTEAITGLDLVELQIRLAEGAPLPARIGEAAVDGHAVEARLYAEDPSNDFLPATGRVALWAPPAVEGVRWDSAVERGSEVSVHYDALLAKVIAHGPTRGAAIDRLAAALRGLAVGGVTTNRDFLLAVLAHREFRAGAIDTHFIDRHLPAGARRAPADAEGARVHAIAAAIDAHERRRRADASPLPSGIASGWRNNRWRAQDVHYRVDAQDLEVRYVARADARFAVECAGRASDVRLADWTDTGIALEIDGVRRRFAIACSGDTVYVHGPLGGASLVELPRFPPRTSEDPAGRCLAPMSGVVRQVLVKPGDRVEQGATLVVLEAMKMEHPLRANAAAMVKEVRVEVGQIVDPDAVMVVLQAEP